MNWQAKYIQPCNCGKCDGRWNVFMDNGKQIPNLSEEDARLIASAPDLLAALKCLLHATMYRDHPEESDIAAAAIAKSAMPNEQA